MLGIRQADVMDFILMHESFHATVDNLVAKGIVSSSGISDEEAL